MSWGFCGELVEESGSQMFCFLIVLFALANIVRIDELVGCSIKIVPNVLFWVKKWSVDLLALRQSNCSVKGERLTPLLCGRFCPMMSVEFFFLLFLFVCFFPKEKKKDWGPWGVRKEAPPSRPILFSRAFDSLHFSTSIWLGNTRWILFLIYQLWLNSHFRWSFSIMRWKFFHNYFAERFKSRGNKWQNITQGSHGSWWNLESPGILFWHFPGLESPAKRL